MSTDVPRISADKVRQKQKSGEDTLLVCAYEQVEKCEQVKLDGSISFTELQQKLPSLANDREIVFYCA